MSQNAEDVYKCLHEHGFQFWCNMIALALDFRNAHEFLSSVHAFMLF